MDLQSKKIIAYCTVVFSLFCSCTDGNVSRVKTIDIDLYQAQEIQLQEEALIGLELNDSSAIYEIANLEELDGKFFVLSRDLIRIFDSTTGKFISNLGSKGDGPGEYIMPRQLLKENEELLLLDSDGGKVIRFDSTGQYISFQRIGNKAGSYSKPIFLMFSPYEEGGYVSVNTWWGGTVPDNAKYSLVDIDMDIVKDLPGREVTSGTFTSDMLSLDEKHHRVLGMEPLVDTVFVVGKSSIEPYFVFDFGKNKFPAEYQASTDIYERMEKFVEGKSIPYASYVTNLSSVGDDLYYTFFTSNDVVYLGKSNVNTGETKVYRFKSDNNRYKQQTFIKVIGDSLLLNFIDNEIVELNPFVYKIPLEQL